VFRLRVRRVSVQERWVRVDGPKAPELAKDLARNLAKAEDALKRDGRIAVPDVVHGQHQMQSYYSWVAHLYTVRNVEAGRLVNGAQFGQLYREAGELAIMFIDGDIAAWNLLRQEDDVYKVLAGQMAPGYEAYRPGMMLEAWLLKRAWRNPFVAWLDWGDDHPESLLKLR
jgi:Acetyltransferase (GNAT) domain